ncbi:MAG: MarR family transcriptional regulator [Candidatus Krumholzibacteria bacterium]|nr:MarR family transcriptional regulator [Candidatus Krumholzibacteria bacterium]
MSDNAENRFPESVAIKGELRQIARQEYTMRKRVLDLFRAGGPMTIPEAASALGISPNEATWWMMGYMRYGYLRATEEVTDEGYYRYAIVEGK